jgi:hypothetical protein
MASESGGGGVGVDGVGRDVPPIAMDPPPAMDRTQFGVVRDRLFHAMLVKVSLAYGRHVDKNSRRCIEFAVLVLVRSLISSHS